MENHHLPTPWPTPETQNTYLLQDTDGVIEDTPLFSTSQMHLNCKT